MRTAPNPIATQEITASSECVFGETLVSDAALAALHMYSEAVNDRRAYEHPLRVVTILYDFVGDRISQGVYDAAALHDMGQRIGPDRTEQHAALSALSSYASTVKSGGEDEYPAWQYTATLLADMDKIEECSQRGRRIGTDDEVVSDLLRSLCDLRVPQSAWSTPSGIVRLQRIEELLRDVNLESVLVKAAEMLDNLRYPAPKERAVLQDVFDAESFYAPVCEAIGLDGLSMALRSAAAVTRLERSGQEDTLATARELLAPLGDREQVLADISGLFQHLFSGETIAETPLHDESGHGIILGHSVLDAPELNEDSTSWVLWRVKSLGSLALKLAEYGKKPVDVLGATILVSDMDKLGMMFRGIAECIQANRVVEARPPQPYTQAFSIQGSEEYIDAVEGYLNGSQAISAKDIRRVDKTNGHHVSKVTFVYKPHVVVEGRPPVEIPVELQVQTVADWRESRTGTAAHLFYKAGSFGDATLLTAIKKRRDYLDSATLNTQSLERGRQFRARVMASTGLLI